MVYQRLAEEIVARVGGLPVKSSIGNGAGLPILD